MAARKNEPVEKEGTEPVVEKKKSRVLMFLTILAGAVVFAGIALGAVVYFIGIPGVVPRLKAAPPPVYENLEFGERVVNLSDIGGGRYLRVRIVLEYKKNEKLSAEIKEKNAQIMDGVLRILRSKNVDEVRPLDKEEKLKGELLNAINGKLKNGKIERIYFTDFLIQ